MPDAGYYGYQSGSNIIIDTSRDRPKRSRSSPSETVQTFLPFPGTEPNNLKGKFIETKTTMLSILFKFVPKKF